MAVSQALKDRAQKSSERDLQVSKNFAMIMLERKIKEQNELSQTSNVPTISTNREALQV